MRQGLLYALVMAMLAICTACCLLSAAFTLEAVAGKALVWERALRIGAIIAASGLICGFALGFRVRDRKS